MKQGSASPAHHVGACELNAEEPPMTTDAKGVEIYSRPQKCR